MLDVPFGCAEPVLGAKNYDAPFSLIATICIVLESFLPSPSGRTSSKANSSRVSAQLKIIDQALVVALSIQTQHSWH